MKYWIVPSNESTFCISEAIEAQNGLVDWRQSNSFAVGDIVFVYIAKPYQCIRFRMEVVKVRLAEEEQFDQEHFWKDKDTYYSGLGIYPHVRFKLIETYRDNILSLHHLHEHGLKGNVQSVQGCPEELLDFLLNPYQTVNDDVYDVDYPEDDDKLYEGALVKVMANRYERNQKARRECVAKKGYKCLVCGRDFETTYGEIGKGFIHVHHQVPISSIGKEYKLDVAKDLVPVCPNCHYMLHRKDPPYTIEELKELIHQRRPEHHYDDGEKQYYRIAAESFVDAREMTEPQRLEVLCKSIQQLIHYGGYKFANRTFCKQRHWIAVYRIAADEGFIRESDFDYFKHIIDEMRLTDCAAPLNISSLQQKIKGIYSKPYRYWNNEGLEGRSLNEYNDVRHIAELFADLLSSNRPKRHI